MSNITTGQVWKNDRGVELTIVAPGHELLRVLSDDIWIAEVKLMTPLGHLRRDQEVPG